METLVYNNSITEIKENLEIELNKLVILLEERPPNEIREIFNSFFMLKKSIDYMNIYLKKEAS
jgi:hypothetical protein